MNYNQFTISEAKAVAIDQKSINKKNMLLMQGENHGDDFIGTYREWCETIPSDEKDARSTGYYDWFLSDERHFEGNMGWFEYRNELLSQLRMIEIIDD